MAHTSKKTVTVLGSTGSIGSQTVSLLSDKKDDFNVIALTCNSSLQSIIEQARQLNPEYIVINSNIAADQDSVTAHMRSLGLRTKCIIGDNAIEHVLSLSPKVDVMVVAISGFACVKVAMRAISSCKILALANKESIVCVWHLMRAEAKLHGTKIVPIDSEHNSIFQTIGNYPYSQIKSITITASGGPFIDYNAQQLQEVSPQEAMRHPVWSMGPKISIDSATLMNKALEMIEAYKLFNINNIRVLIHKQAIVHSIIELNDNFCVAGMAPPNMKMHIANALTWPERIDCNMPALNLAAIGALYFQEVDTELFPAVKMAHGIMHDEKSLATIFNAANEEAVTMFARGAIGFTQITEVIGYALQNADNIAIDNLETAIMVDKNAREIAASFSLVKA